MSSPDNSHKGRGKTVVMSLVLLALASTQAISADGASTRRRKASDQRRTSSTGVFGRRAQWLFGSQRWSENRRSLAYFAHAFGGSL